MEKLDQVLLQTFIAFFAILILTRILGKQQINQLTFYEYINGITFGSIAANLASDTDQHMVLHLAGLIFWDTNRFDGFYFYERRAFKETYSW